MAKCNRRSRKAVATGFDVEGYIRTWEPAVMAVMGARVGGRLPDAWMHLHGDSGDALNDLVGLVAEMFFDYPGAAACAAPAVEYHPGQWAASVAYWGSPLGLMGMCAVLHETLGVKIL